MRWAKRAMDEFLKAFKSVAEALGLSRHPIGVSIIVGLLCGLACYGLLTSSTEKKTEPPAPPTVFNENKTSGKESPIMPENKGTVIIDDHSSPANKDHATPPK